MILNKKTNPALTPTVPAGSVLIFPDLAGNWKVKKDDQSFVDLGGGGGSTFRIQQDGSLDANSIGRVAMMRPDGKCKVYANSPAVTQQAGKFRITVDNVVTSPFLATAEVLSNVLLSTMPYAVGDNIIIGVAGWVDRINLTVVASSPAVDEVKYDADWNVFRTNLIDAINNNCTWATRYPNSIKASDVAGSLLVEIQNTAPFWFNLAYNNVNEGYSIYFTVADPNKEMKLVTRFAGNPASVQGVGSDSYLLIIAVDGSSIEVRPEAWRGFAGQNVWDVAASPADEAALIVNFLNGSPYLPPSTFITYTAGTNFFDVESTVTSKFITVTMGSGFPYTKTTITEPLRAVPPAPTAYPLGKIVSYDSTHAEISSNMIDNFVASGNIVCDFSRFDILTFDLDLTDPIATVFSLLEIAVIPTDDGKVRQFNLAADLPNALSISSLEELKAAWRHVGLGLPFSNAADGEEVVVLTGLGISTLAAGAGVRNGLLSMLFGGF